MKGKSRGGRLPIDCYSSHVSDISACTQKGKLAGMVIVPHGPSQKPGYPSGWASSSAPQVR